MAQGASRAASCSVVLAFPEMGGHWAGVHARDTSGHSYGAQAQAFVNWADDNPHLWEKAHGFIVGQSSFWSEFPCEAAN